MEKENRPSHASWESTLECPLRCRHCGLDAKHVKPDELTTKEAKDMLSTIYAFGVKHLIISGGEFTSRKDWVEILEFSLSLFKSVRMITSGWLGEELFVLLRKIENIDNLSISVSLDGLKEKHDQRRGKGSFDKVLEIIKYPSSIPRTVLTTVDILNITDCLDILGLCMRFHIPLWSIQISLPAGRMDPKLFLGKTRIKLFPDRKWDGCYAGRSLITILNNGLITGCPTMSNIIAGNIKTDPIEEIWNSVIMRNFCNEKPMECKTCGQCAGGCKTVSKLFNEQFCLTIN